MAAKKKADKRVDHKDLRIAIDPKKLGFKTTADLEPLEGILGQERGVEAFRFGMGMQAKGYNIFLTGPSGTGRLSTVKKLLKDLSRDDRAPDDLCYVNDFKHPEAPILLRFRAGEGQAFKKDVQTFVEGVKRDVPQLFESEEYIQRKHEIMEAHEKQVLEFYQAVEERVKNTGLVVVKMQTGSFQRPDVVPLVDGEPKRMMDLENMVENGRFPKDEFERLQKTRTEVKDEVDHIVQEVRRLQKEVARKLEEVDRLMFRSLARDAVAQLKNAYPEEKVVAFLDAMVEDMVENLDAIRQLGAQQPQGMPPFMTPNPEAVLRPYTVNLLVDNAQQEGPPVVIESFPTYRNLFGSIERAMDQRGGWQTDFTKIKAGSFVKANGGYLVVNLMDAVFEPGVWQTLKRSLKAEEIEIQTYDPYYFFTASGLKPEPITMEVKVVAYADARLYGLLRRFDPDLPKIFKVRADWETSMDRTDDAVAELARFVRAECDKEGLVPFAASGVAAVAEEAVRMAGRQEKLTTAFPDLADLLAEAAYFAGREAKAKAVTGDHVRQALVAGRRRLSRIEERIQEMIDRGSLFVDTDGAVVGQVNGLAVYSMGDYAFGKPSRITAVTAMGRDGVINIEREADLSGNIHNKGVSILSGFLRRTFAQKRPLALTASITFEQGYGGVDGDSASSTELYAILSSLSGFPIRQDVAVTGSVNQKGEIQPIGGVNEKVEGFYRCCEHLGLTREQGVMIPRANVKDLMLDPDVAEAIRAGRFHLWAVSTVEEGVELLMGAKAGSATKTGFTRGSVYAAADAKLKDLAEGLRDWSKENNKGKGKKKA